MEERNTENAVYLNMKNDLSFVIHMELSLYEHQSAYNPNLPIRELIYVAKVYQGMLKDENLYGETLVKIPTSRFITFYNGVDLSLNDKCCVCLMHIKSAKMSQKYILIRRNHCHATTHKRELRTIRRIYAVGGVYKSII